jgi:hypothetical protein
MAHDHDGSDVAYDRMAMVCARVIRGEPLVMVSRDDGGCWMFLCEGDHAGNAGDPPTMLCLGCAFERDPTLAEVADLDPGESVERAAPDQPWALDEPRATVVAAIDRRGWAVRQVPAGVVGDQPFAYTVGLFSSYRHPELITFGAREQVLRYLLDVAGKRIRKGARAPLGQPVDWTRRLFRRGYPIQFREVRDPASYACYLRAAIRHHGPGQVPLLQLVWSDEERRFPGDPGVRASFTDAQPFLP